jgi:hypothetical protein
MMSAASCPGRYNDRQCPKACAVSSKVVIGPSSLAAVYQRQKFLDLARRRDLFLEILEQVRAKYDFVVAG